jgi:cell division protein FtsZ
VLQGAVQGIAELITRPGLINVDFADVRTVMSETGMAMMGSGTASGDDRAREAAEAAISSPLLEDINLAGAQGILVNVTAGMDLSIGEFQEVGNVIKQFASDEATVVVGTVIDADMTNQIRVTVVATGLGRPISKSVTPPLIPTVMQAWTPGPTRSKLGPAPLSSGQGRSQRRSMQMAPADYNDYEKPAAQRRASGDGLSAEAEGEDLLDIPAFLRRQAD